MSSSTRAKIGGYCARFGHVFGAIVAQQVRILREPGWVSWLSTRVALVMGPK